jgi:hypothetical protein
VERVAVDLDLMEGKSGGGASVFRKEGGSREDRCSLLGFGWIDAFWARAFSPRALDREVLTARICSCQVIRVKNGFVF